MFHNKTLQPCITINEEIPMLYFYLLHPGIVRKVNNIPVVEMEQLRHLMNLFEVTK